jgi:hypothetical protein
MTKMRWNDQWLDLRSPPVVFVEDPEDPGNYHASKLFLGETDPGVGGDVPYAWIPPSDLAPTVPVIVSQSISLSTTTPNSLSFVQWGTEEAVIAQADAPNQAVVMAWVTGYLQPGPGTISAGSDRGNVKLQVSFDGGANFSDIGNVHRITLWGTNVTRGSTVSNNGRALGTVTGDIQVRAMVNDNDAANDTTWNNGYIMVLVHSQ